MISSRRVFRRFFSVYLIFLLCMLILTLPAYRLVLRETEQRALEALSATMGTGMELLDNTLWSASAAAASMYTNANIYPVYALSEPLQPRDFIAIRKAIDEYKDSTEVLSMVSDSGLFMRNRSLLASSRFFIDAEDAYNTFLKDEKAASFDEWAEQLSLSNSSYSLTPMEITTERGTRDAIVFAMTLPLNAKTKKCFFYAVYNVDDILDLLIIPKYSNACSLKLYDSTGKNLIDYRPNNPRDTVSLNQNSSSYHLSATVEIDTAVFSQEMRAFRLLILLMGALFLVGGIIIVVAFSWRSARPMVRMLHAAEETSREAGVTIYNTGTSGDSYAYFHSFINQMGEEVTISKRAQEEQRLLLRESVLERLLQDNSGVSDTMYEHAQQCFPNFPNCCRMLLVKLLHLRGLGTSQMTAMQAYVVENLRSYLPDDTLIHTLADSNNLTAAVIPCLKNEEKGSFEALLAGLSQHIRQYPDMEAQFVVSMPFEGMEKLPQVYKQLSLLLRLAGEKGEPAIYADDLPTTIPGAAIGNRSKHFYESVIGGDSDVALMLLDQEVEEMKSLGVVKEAEVQQLFFIYRHALNQACAEIQIDPIDLPDYRSQLTVDEIFDQLRDCCLRICESVNQHKQSNEEFFERKVIGFINEHLSDPNLCVNLVTDQFGISESSLRRIMLKTTNGGFLEYVERQRMDKARNLLVHTDMPVGKIPEQCGYISHNSFYKAFRRYFESSPSAFREQAQGASGIK